MTGEMKISIDDFDPYQNKAINSPRSVASCKKLGLSVNELFIPNREGLMYQYNQTPGPSRQSFDQFAKYFASRISKKIERISQERQNLISSREASLTSSVKGNNERLQENNVTLLEREKLMLQTIKQRQKQEVNLLIQQEIRMQEMQERNERK